MLKRCIFVASFLAASPLAEAQIFQRELGDFDLKLGTTPTRSMAQGLVKPAAVGSFHGGLDAGAVVLVQARVDVRGAGGEGDAVVHRAARHRQRDLERGRAVVDAGQQVVVQVDHGRIPTLHVMARMPG